MSDAEDFLAELYGDNPREAFRNPLMQYAKETYQPWPALPPLPRRYSGEVMNSVPRPADWAEWSGVGENAGLAPLRTGPGLGELLGRYRQAISDQDLGAVADLAPFAAGIFGFGRRAPIAKAIGAEMPARAPLGRNDPSRPPVFVPDEAVPKSTSGVSLSQNLRSSERPSPTEGLPFEYIIYKDGIPLGSVGGWANGDKMHIGGFDVKGGPNALGVAGIRQLHEAVTQDFPDISVFAGSRARGAGGKEQMWRREEAGWRSQNRDQEIDFSKRAGVPERRKP